MTQTVKECREHWVIIPLTVIGRGVTQIDYRMPSTVFHCTGVMASISGVRGFYIQTRLGEYSLSFNNRASQPLNLSANWSPYRSRLDRVLYKLEEPLIGGSRVTGYFRNIFEFPYTIQIYLQCLSHLKTATQT